MHVRLPATKPLEGARGSVLSKAHLPDSLGKQAKCLHQRIAGLSQRRSSRGLPADAAHSRGEIVQHSASLGIVAARGDVSCNQDFSPTIFSGCRGTARDIRNLQRG